MNYMTIIHEMLLQRPKTRSQLRKSRTLLTTMERYAKELRANHEAWKEMLLQLHPDSHPMVVASEALEIALKEMEDRLPSDSAEETDPQVLEAAMMFIQRRTSRG